MLFAAEQTETGTLALFLSVSRIRVYVLRYKLDGNSFQVGRWKITETANRVHAAAEALARSQTTPRVRTAEQSAVPTVAVATRSAFSPTMHGRRCHRNGGTCLHRHLPSGRSSPTLLRMEKPSRRRTCISPLSRRSQAAALIK